MAALPEPTAGPAPWTLRAAGAGAAALGAAEAVLVAGRDGLTVGLRALLVVGLVGLTWLFAWRVQHRSAGAALGLLLLEGTTVLAAVGATGLGAGARLGLAAGALTVAGLLVASLQAFPPPTLPPHAGATSPRDT